MKTIISTDKQQYCIYKITNNINGKCYIGQHIVKKEYPRQYMGKGFGIQKAYKIYGRQNFTKEILETIEDTKERKIVSQREKYWIKKLNTLEPNGYNKNEGGFGGCSSEAGKKAALTRKKNNYKVSQETKNKISLSNKGKSKSILHKQHLSENHHLKTEHIIQFENGNEISTYMSIINIAKLYGTNKNTLLRYSAKGQFINGIRLKDIEKSKYKCCQTYKSKEESIKCFDPIKKDYCSLKNLKQRKHRHPVEYSTVDTSNCIVNEERM